MTQPFLDVVDAINARLDAREVIKRLGFRVDGISQIGTKLKCYCPVHRGETFKSLQVDLAENSCQCIVKDCAARETQTLVSLYAHVRSTTPIAAALELAKASNIAIDSSQLRTIEAHYLAQAEEAIAAGDLEGAATSLEVATQACPDSAELQLRLGETQEKLGNSKAACAAWLAAAKCLISIDPHRAVSILESKVTPLAPDDAEVIGLQATALRACGKSSSAVADLVLRRALLLEEKGQPEEALATLEEAIADLQQNAAAMRLYATLLIRAERDFEGYTQLRIAADLYRNAGQYQEAVELYKQLAEHDPDSEELQRILAEISFDLGDQAGYLENIQKLITRAKSLNRQTEVEALCEDILQHIPEHTDSHNELIAIAKAEGVANQIAYRLLNYAAVQKDCEDREGLRATLVELDGVEIADVSQIETMAEHYEFLGDLDKAYDLRIRCAETLIVLHEVDEAEAQLRRAIKLNVKSEEETLRRAVDIFAAQDFSRHVRKFWERIADICEKERRERDLLEALDKAISYDPRHSGLADRRLEILFRQKDEGRLEAAVLEKVASLSTDSTHAEARALLERALTALPNSLPIIEKSADLAILADDLNAARGFLRMLSDFENAPMDLRIRAAAQAVELDIGDYEALLILGQLQESAGESAQASLSYQQAAELLIAEGESEQALEAMASAARLSPEDTRLLELAGDMALQSGEAEAAAAKYRQYFEAVVRTNDRDAIRNSYARMMEKLPHNIDFPEIFAQWWEAEGEPQKAAVLYYDAARTARSNGDGEKAIYFLEQAEKNVPEEQNALFLRAEIEAEQGNAENATAVLRRINGDALEDSRNRERLEFLATLTDLTPDEAFVLAKLRVYAGENQAAVEALNSAFLLIDEKDTEQTIRFAEPLLSLDETLFDVRKRYAKALAESEQPQLAAQQYLQLGRSLTEADEDESALNYFESARDLDPDNLDIRRHLIELHLRQKASDSIREEALALAKQFEALGEHETIISLLTKLNESMGGDADILERIAESQITSERLDDAADTIRCAVDLRESAGELEKAIELLNRIRQFTDASREDRERLAEFYVRNADLSIARVIYTELLRESLEAGEKSSAQEEYIAKVRAICLDDWTDFQPVFALLQELASSTVAIEAAETFIAEADSDKNLVSIRDACQAIIAADEKNIEASQRLASTLHQLGDPVGSQAEYQRLLRLLESDESGRRLEVATEAINNHPSALSLQLEYLRALVEAGESDEAARKGEKLIASLRSDGLKTEAAKVAELLSANIPDRIDFVYCHAEILAESERIDEAKNVLRAYVKRQWDADPQEARNALEFLLDYYPDSADDLETLYTLVNETEGEAAARPLQLRSLTLYASLYAENIDTLTEKFEHLIASAPKHYDLRRRVAEVLADLGHKERAVATLQALVSEFDAGGEYQAAIRAQRSLVVLAPTEIEERKKLAQLEQKAGAVFDAAESWKGLAEEYSERGEIQEELNALLRVIELTPDSEGVLARVADIYREQNDFERAVEYYLHLADVCIDRGNKATAISSLEQSAQLLPNNPQVLYRLALLYVTADHERGLVMAELCAARGLEDEDAFTREEIERLSAEYPGSDIVTRGFLRVIDCAKDTEYYIQSVSKSVAAALLRKDEAFAAGVLSDASLRMLGVGKFTAVRNLLAEYDALCEGSPNLIHSRALAFEGEGDELTASIEWSRLAELHEGAGNIQEAERALRRALALSPRSHGLHQSLIELLLKYQSDKKAELSTEYLELGRLFEQDQQWTEAEVCYTGLLRVDEDHVEALQRLAAIQYRLDKIEESADSLHLLGDKLNSYGDADAAAQAYRDALSRVPDRLLTLRALLHLLDEQNEREEASEIARKLLAVCDEMGEEAEAREALRKLCEYDPQDVDAQQRLADEYLKLEEVDRAAAILRSLYNTHFNEGSLSKAIEVLHRIESIDSENPETLELLGSLYHKLQDVEQANQYLLAAAVTNDMLGRHADALRITDEILEISPNDEATHSLRADIFEKTGELESCRDELLILSDVHESVGEYEKQLLILERALRHVPHDLDLRRKYANLLSDLEEDSAAADQFLLLSRAHREAGDLDDAVDAAFTATTIMPESTAALSFLSDLYIQRNELTRSDETLLRLARLYESQDQLDEALTALKKCVMYSKEPSSLLLAGKILTRLGNKTEAIETFQAVQSLSGLTEAQRREAAVGAFSADPASLESLRNLVRSADEGSDTGQREIEGLYIKSFGRLLEIGEIDSARALLKEAVQKLRDDLSLRRKAIPLLLENGLPELAAAEHVYIAISLESLGKFKEALQEVDACLAIKPNDLPAMKLKLRILQGASDLDAAADFANQLVDALVERNSFTESVGICRSLLQQREDNIPLRRRLIALLQKQGQREEEAKELSILANQFLASGSPSEATECFQRMMEIDSENPAIIAQYLETYRQIAPEKELLPYYTRLANLYAKNGSTLEATETFERALEIDQVNAPILSDFVTFLVTNGQVTRATVEAMRLAEVYIGNAKYDEAVECLQRFEANAKDDPRYHELLAQAYQAKNFRGLAMKEYLSAASLYDKKGNTTRKDVMLAHLGDVDPKEFFADQERIDTLLKSKKRDEALDVIGALAKKYDERGFGDLAESELRRGLSIDPLKTSLWTALIDLKSAEEDKPQRLALHLEMANEFATASKPRDAADAFLKALELDSKCVEAHRGYITQYVKFGREEDIVDEILEFALLLVEEAEIDEASRYFELVRSIDPSNAVAHEMLSATQGRYDRSSAERRSPAPKDGEPEEDAAEGVLDDSRLSDSQKLFIRDKTTSASDFLAGTLGAMDIEESQQALADVATSYREVLGLNPQSADVRLKLADILEQMGHFPEMLEQLDLASETLLAKADLQKCIDSCERYLKLKPNAGRIRKRLNEAILKRDAFKALESAIVYIDPEDR